MPTTRRAGPPAGRPRSDRERLLQRRVRDALGPARLVVVANREPYLHVYDDAGDQVRCLVPASGLVTALDPVLRACGGVWIAHGSGSADVESADASGRVAVPPGDPRYTLRRVWMTREEERGYYYGFSNDALWPLCHVAYTRPTFDASDFARYREINQRFADAVLDEIAGQPAVVFVQDYHFALLPRQIKARRPDVTVCQFWHIPWPNPEAFRICPWQGELLEGLLGNDLLAFHIQGHAINFADTVDRALEARVDRDRFGVIRGGHTTLLRPFPIGVDPFMADDHAPWARVDELARQLRRRAGLRGERIVMGVDRIDYTKGIPERLQAFDRFLDRYPEHRGKVALLQLGAPSRTVLAAYRRLQDEIDDLVARINWKHGDGRWEPIRVLREHHDADRVYTAYRIADACVVSSLHDGMNLVAKEFVAARDDLGGALILSRFTGAARELADACLVNPYATDDFADAFHLALSLSAEDKARRMERMRRAVLAGDVYAWAGELLAEAGRLSRDAAGPAAP